MREGTSRPWSYGAGAYVTTMGIQIGAWLLRDVLDQVRRAKPGAPLPDITLDPAAWLRSATDIASPDETATPGVLLWEAFVSGPGHARAPNARGVSEHIQDAATAAVAFRSWCSILPRSPSAVSCDSPIATLGAIALWAGWTKDLALLSQQPLVYFGRISHWAAPWSLMLKHQRRTWQRMRSTRSPVSVTPRHPLPRDCPSSAEIRTAFGGSIRVVATWQIFNCW